MACLQKLLKLNNLVGNRNGSDGDGNGIGLWQCVELFSNLQTSDRLSWHFHRKIWKNWKKCLTMYSN